MRTRKEIEKSFETYEPTTGEWQDDGKDYLPIEIELLLDIRDLLTPEKHGVGPINMGEIDLRPSSNTEHIARDGDITTPLSNINQ